MFEETLCELYRALETITSYDDLNFSSKISLDRISTYDDSDKAYKPPKYINTDTSDRRSSTRESHKVQRPDYYEYEDISGRDLIFALRIISEFIRYTKVDARFYRFSIPELEDWFDKWKVGKCEIPSANIFTEINSLKPAAKDLDYEQSIRIIFNT
jgi:hypothetical protein